jgi:hypothetical protein
LALGLGAQFDVRTFARFFFRRDLWQACTGWKEEEVKGEREEERKEGGKQGLKEDIPPSFVYA